MLYFNLCLTENAIIDQHICMGMQAVILHYMNTMLERTVRAYDPALPDCTPKDLKSFSKGERKFINTYRGLYPSWYSEEKMFPLFAKLYALIKDTDRHIPDLEMEYLLASIITAMAEQNEICEIWGYTLPSNEVMILKEELAEHYEDEEAAEEVDSYQVPCHLWLEVCFMDSDFELLDTMDTDTLLHSDINKLMGIFDSVSYSVIGDWWSDDAKVISVDR